MLAAFLGQYGEQLPAKFTSLLSQLPVLSDQDYATPEKAARIAVERLYGLFDRYEFPAMPPGPSNLRSLVALGWWTVVNRQAAAIAALDAAGMASESVPNARSALEHSIALVLLSRKDEAEAVPGGLVRGILADLLRGARTRPAEEDPAALQIIESVADECSDLEGDWPSKFTSHLTLLGVRSALYVYYVNMCLLTHPTFSSVIAFSDVTGEVRPSHKPNPSILRGPAGTPILWAVQCQCWSGLAIDRLLPDGWPWRDRLVAIADELEVPLRSELFD
jgi:hypothetical protein